MTVLPPLEELSSPNQSLRIGGVVPYLVVVHRPVGSYAGATATFMDPKAQVSAHVLTNGTSEARQFVRWDRKAWACMAYNSVSYNVEVDDRAWAGNVAALAVAARIVGFICTKTGIPATWARDPRFPGITRHYDLGAPGGGHTDPTLDVALWAEFVKWCAEEVKRGGYRQTWGFGSLPRIPAT